MEILKAGKQIVKKSLIAALLCASAIAIPAQAQEARQYKIEAAYLYNFFNYITWPGYAAPQDLHKANICLYGDDPIEPYLAYMEHKMVGERALKIRKIAEGSSTGGCQIMFVRRLPSHDDKKSIATNTLVVFDSTDPLDQGGMIELSHENEHIVMKINQAALAENGFQVSSRLLDLARD